MKDFDLDKIKERQLYKMPEQFFENMQQNVLEKTVLQKETKIIPNNKTKPDFNKWLFAAAACIVLFFGSIFVFQKIEKRDSSNNVNTVVNQDTPLEITKPVKSAESTPTLIADVQENQASDVIKVENTSINKENNEAKVTFAINEINKKSTPNINKSLKTIKTKAVTKQSNSEDQINLLLQNLTAEELEMIAQNSEKDVYLDVYY